MEVYVVSLAWWRDGSEVVGVGAELSDAEAIADRDSSHDDPRIAGWSPWRRIDGSSGPSKVIRDALLADGSIHPSVYQEIVCVPLEKADDPCLTLLKWAHGAIEGR